MRRFASLLRLLTRRREFEDDLEEELRLHLEARVEHLMENGLPREQATRQARIEFGNVEAVRESVREVSMLHWIDELKRNLIFGLRLLRQRPAFSAVAIVTLALCIGANSAVFTLIDATLLRDLPYPEPERLAEIVTEYRSPEGEGVSVAQSGRVWEAIRDHATTVRSAVYSTWHTGAYLASGDSVTYVEQQRVGSGFFEVLGLDLLLGREFTSEEDRPNGPATVVIGHELWQSTFGGDPSVLGESVTLAGEPHTVIGVLAPGYLPSVGADLWTPLRASSTGEGSGTNFRIVSRLEESATWSEAEAQVAAIGEEVVSRPDRADVEVSLGLAPFDRELRRGLRPLLFVLWAAVGAILLIGCTNLATMLIARGDEREREIATRVAIGGGRGAVIRQLLTESLVLALVGGALAIVVARVLLVQSEARLRETFGIWQPLELDLRAVVATTAIAVVTCVLFGLLPALRASRVDVRRGLVDTGTRGAASGARRWPRRAAVIGQVALCVVLLVAAGLLLRSVQHLRSLSPGFDPEGVVTAQVALRDARYEDADAVRGFFRRTLEAARSVPGVESAAVGLSLPFERGLNMPFQTPDSAEGEYQLTTLVYVTPQYFESLGIPLLRGRVIDERDRAETAPVMVVNRAFLERYLDEDAGIGAQIRVSDLEPAEVVGVVGDVQQRPGWGDGSVGPLAPMPTAYVPVDQLGGDFFGLVHTWFSPTWVVRSEQGAAAVTPSLQAAVAGVDPLLPLIRFRTMDEVRSESIGMQRVQATLLAVFSALALLLAAAGVYGVLANVVASRRRELGIRMALGATRTEAMSTVTRDGLRLIVVGLLIGIPAALLAATALRGAIFGVEPIDPPTLLAVSVLLLASGLAASVLPALKVARLDPAETLRDD